jgi:hypothetical protein
MENRIRRVTVEVRRLSSAEAEVWVVAEVEAVTPRTELRGRLVGPRCPGTSTIEVPYPLRPPPRPASGPHGTLAARVVIPEPNLWTAAMPFVYEGPLELWQDGERCDTATVSVALKPAADERPPCPQP